MLRMLKVVEITWIVMAVISAFEVVNLWNQPGDKKWYFLGFMVFAIFMFFFRRRYRLRYEKRKKEQDTHNNTN